MTLEGKRKCNFCRQFDTEDNLIFTFKGKPEGYFCHKKCFNKYMK